MRMTRLGAVLASLAISTASAALLAQTGAQATTPVATTTKLAINQHTTVKGVYRQRIGFLETNIADDHGGLVFTGSAVLQRRLPGKAWKKVKIDHDGSDGMRWGANGTHAKGNVQYRVHFLGGTDPNTSTTYAPSFSNIVTVITLWKVKDTSACPGGRCHISGKLVPTAKHKKLIVQIKQGGWRTFKVLHTSAKSKYQVGVATRGGKPTRYRLLIPGTKTLTGVKLDYTVHRV